MKKPLKTITFVTLLFTLTGCVISPNNKIVEIKDATVSLYSFIGKNNTDKLSDYYLKDVSFKYIKGQEYMPYLDIETFAGLYLNLHVDGYKSTFEHYLDGDVWLINNKSTPIFQAIFNYEQKIISYAGATTGAFISTSDASSSSLQLGMYNTATIVNPDTKSYFDLDYSNSDYKTYTINTKTYYPLSMLNTFMTSLSSFKVFYNYNDLYVYDDDSVLWNKTYQPRDNDKGPKADMKDVIDNKLHKVMPLYLRQERLSNIYFLFDNFYGLKDTRNIESMREYIEDKGYDKGMLSENNNTRNEATYKFFAELDDGHTRLMTNDNMKDLWGNADDNYPFYGELWVNRINLRSSLSLKRQDAYIDQNKEVGEVIYSSDEKTAMISFDGFTFTNNAYNPDGSISNRIYDEDTFFFLAKALEEIKTNGKGTKNVILDIACNGGGTVGVMMKIITLLSKNNSSMTYLYRKEMNALLRYVTIVDSNIDQNYYVDDVYGDDFDFYILQSEFSFSCGNAFPFFLELNGLATMIGQTSGGGECAVAANVLPTGETFRHSSNMHICWKSGDTYVGDEAGVTPSIEIDYNDFYDIDKVAQMIQK